MLISLVAVAVLAPVLAPYDPDALVGPSLARPDRAFLLGTNDLGQDILARLIFGARTSLVVGLAVALVATTIGTLVGVTAGLVRGSVDEVLMRGVDVLLAIPFIPLLIVLQVFLGAGAPTLIVILAAVMWARPARELRSQVLSVRERGHVQAALAMGAGWTYLLRRHVLPEITALIVPQVVRIARGAILVEASLSFLGLGDPTLASWGTMLFHAQSRSAYLTDAWLWWILPPGLAIGATVLAVALVGYALEERARPRLMGDWRPVETARLPAHGIPQPTSPEIEGSGPPLALESIRVRYGDTGTAPDAVADASLYVRRAEIVGLVGESGSGKTTLATVALGVVRSPGRIVSGSVVVGGADFAKLSAEQRRFLRGRVVALVPQNAMNALNPVRDITSQLVEALGAHRQVSRSVARERTAELLASVGIPANRHDAYPHELSGGMQQRVLIAMALVNDPDVLVADEPTTGLDQDTADAVLRLIDRIRSERGLGVLMISHDLEAVLRVADRLVVMHEGRVVETATVGALRARPRHRETRRLLRALPPAVDPAGGRGDVATLSGPHRPTDTGPGPAGPNGTPPSRTRTSGTLLEVRGLRKSFPLRGVAAPLLVLDGVDLDVAEGEIVGLLGPSGVGKSTLGRIIVGLEEPDGGRVVFRGREILSLRRRERRRLAASMHFVFQDPYESLPEHMSIATIVSEPMAIQRTVHPSEWNDRVEKALDRVGLGGTFAFRFPHELSGGERQRVALARAIVLDPLLIVADEPASLLDAPLKADILALLASLRDSLGTTIVQITHDRASALATCDRIVEMELGRIYAGAPSAAVIAFGE